MRSSDQIDKLAAALAKAQAEFPVLPTTKTVTAKTYAYSYTELLPIKMAIQPIMAANGLCVVQMPGVVDGGSVLNMRIMHASGQWIEESVPLSKGIPSPQDLGGLISFMSRYSLISGLGLKTGDTNDDGERVEKSFASKQKSEKPPVAPKSPTTSQPKTEPRATQAQISAAWNLIKSELKKDDVGAREFMVRVTGKQSSDSLMSSDIDRLMLAIKKEKATTPKEVLKPTNPSSSGGSFWDENL